MEMSTEIECFSCAESFQRETASLRGSKSDRNRRISRRRDRRSDSSRKLGKFCVASRSSFLGARGVARGKVFRDQILFNHVFPNTGSSFHSQRWKSQS